MSEQLTLSQRVLQAMGTKPLSAPSIQSAMKMNASGLRLLLGRMKARGEIVEVAAGVWQATGAEPIKRERKKREKAPPPEPVPFDCGVFMDGTVVITGDGLVDAAGVIRLNGEQAEAVRTLLNRNAPFKVAA